MGFQYTVSTHSEVLGRLESNCITLLNYLLGPALMQSALCSRGMAVRTSRALPMSQILGGSSGSPFNYPYLRLALARVCEHVHSRYSQDMLKSLRGDYDGL